MLSDESHLTITKANSIETTGGETEQKSSAVNMKEKPALSQIKKSKKCILKQSKAKKNNSRQLNQDLLLD